MRKTPFFFSKKVGRGFQLKFSAGMFGKQKRVRAHRLGVQHLVILRLILQTQPYAHASGVQDGGK